MATHSLLPVVLRYPRGHNAIFRTSLSENGEPSPAGDAIICHEMNTSDSNQDPEPDMSIEFATDTETAAVATARPRPRRAKAAAEPASPTYYDVVPSPIGDLYLTARDGAITGLHMGENFHIADPRPPASPGRRTGRWPSATG